MKSKGVYMQIYPHLSCLLSYTTYHVYLMDQYANYLKIVFMNIKNENKLEQLINVHAKFITSQLLLIQDFILTYFVNLFPN